MGSSANNPGAGPNPDICASEPVSFYASSTTTRLPSIRYPCASFASASTYAACSSSRIRAARVAAVSSSCTGDGALHDDRAGVEMFVDEVDGAAGDFHAVRDRLRLRVDAGKRGQQRRMDVQDAVRASARRTLR